MDLADFLFSFLTFLLDLSTIIFFLLIDFSILFSAIMLHDAHLLNEFDLFFLIEKCNCDYLAYFCIFGCCASIRIVDFSIVFKLFDLFIKFKVLFIYSF